VKQRGAAGATSHQYVPSVTLTSDETGSLKRDQVVSDRAWSEEHLSRELPSCMDLVEPPEDVCSRLTEELAEWCCSGRPVDACAQPVGAG
jgi:hypothetical protein